MRNFGYLECSESAVVHGKNLDFSENRKQRRRKFFYFIIFIL